MMRIEAKNTERNRAELKVPSLAHGQTNPTCSQHPAEMTVGEPRDISRDLGQTSYQTVRTIRNPSERFTVRDAVLEDIPSRPLPG